ncbi:MAG: alpha/beta fold hydrolase, partial [Pseudomonadota bacterium]
STIHESIHSEARMSKAAVTEKLFIEGPAVRLEAILESPDEPTGCAVVCHPHPQHGGTMHNKVAHTLARAFVRSGFATLRFNFRGTEGSEGEYDAGNGELDDALAAIHWISERHPDVPIWLAGFSFGAAIAAIAGGREPLDGLITVAPAITRVAPAMTVQPECPWLIVQGDEDELVDVDETIAWVDSLEPGPELLVIEGGEHFFHGRLIDLREASVEFIARNSA